MTNLEMWNTVTLATLSLVSFVLFYAWTAIALGAVFRKSGESAWKAWVPVLNLVVFLQVAGLSAWLVLLFLVPVVGFVLLVVASYRVNVAFGHGGGMTVLAALLFPIWATVLGFGPDRWLGREEAARGPVRTGLPDIAPPPPLPGSPAAPAYTPTAPPPAYGRPAPAAGWTPPPLPPTPASSVAAAPAPPAPASPLAAAPTAPTAAPSAGPAPAVPPVPPPAPAAAFPAPAAPAPAAAFPAPAAPAPAAPAPASGVPTSAVPSWAATDRDDTGETPVDSASAPAFPPIARRSAAPLDAPAWELPDEDSEPSWDFDFGAASATSEVTDAVSGAPAPVSAAPRRSVPADAPGLPDEAPSAMPPVTQVPAAPTPAVSREPWAPAPSPMPGEGDAFAESSGPVSAIAGAPDAGMPRSARSSVSALHTSPHIPEEDELEETIVARRKRTAWTLTTPSGARVPLTADTVILGRRPSVDPEFPGAQLVSLDDDTRTVSKTHARLELREDRWFITDLGSTNGVLFTTLMGTEVAAEPGEATEAGERFLLGDAEVSLNRSDA
ncbi:DUF5684 domain-containing protein [Microbacterium sp. B2969]|uniref:DUF5684 domain-containing protein n=1 Tax=Microbacterium alkaliflavum TaxID=3248839 RepID=A0ABW7QBD5_9MICO